MATIYGDSIIIFDEVSIIRQRIGNLLQDYNIDVYEVSHDVELFNLLVDNKLNVCLIIMDVDYDINKGFRILSRIIEKKSDVPVFILTSNNKKETVLRGFTEGAADYILKPFKDNYLLEKILSIFNKKRKDNVIKIDSSSEVVFDIQSYLTTELRKATKGNYEITVVMCSFFVPADEINTKVENRFRLVSELFYKNFIRILWETDIFIRYGLETFIGIFPYCGLDSMDKILKKITDSFNEVKKLNEELYPFQMILSTMTYPSEANNPNELLLSLNTRMQNEIDEKMKIDIEDTDSNDTDSNDTMVNPEILLV